MAFEDGGRYRMASSRDESTAPSRSGMEPGDGGRTTFQWFDGKFFLIQRATAEDPSVRGIILSFIEVGRLPIRVYY
jgi:hypothetical protein